MSESVSHTLPTPENRILFFTKQVDQSSISDITKKIISINNADKALKKIYKINGVKYKPKPIKIYIDSYGGQVYQCFGLLSIMKASKTEIHTIVTGCAMSCGFMVLIFGHKRFAYPLSTPMYHQVSSGVWGKLKHMEEDVDEAKRLQTILEDLTFERTKMTRKHLKDIFKTKKDLYMSAEEALKLGVVDEILQEIPE